MTDGILNVDKPSGPTSHDVVQAVRNLTGIRRVGHAGTLDPLATGVLLVCLGKATRVSEYLMRGRKTYRGRLRLGVTTDTYDAEGEIVAERPVDLSRQNVEDALDPFRGDIEQVPPMYSAVKQNGTPLHVLARQGIEVKRKPRKITIYALELTDWSPPECTLEVVCSSGTYVRSLAYDLGQALGCGAHIVALRRLASGRFHAADAVSMEELKQAAEDDRWTEHLQPIDAALAQFPALHLSAESAHRLCSGQTVAYPDLKPEEGSLARAYGPSGEFLAIARYDPEQDVWWPHKVFRTPGS